jgi:serine/threonine protein kinase
LLVEYCFAYKVFADFLRWHQDVKPDNILVKSNGIDSPYDWKFKLSDLGLSHFKRESQEGSDFDAYGTETYGKPTPRDVKSFPLTKSPRCTRVLQSR